MPSLWAHAWITAALFAAIVILAIAGNVLQTSGAIAAGAETELAAKVIFLGLATALFLSAIPLIVTAVLRAQVRLGNGSLPLVRSLIAHPWIVVLIYWAVVALGLAVALPAAIRAGMFSAS